MRRLWGKAKRPRRVPGVMNTLEKRYADEVLEPQLLAGEILAYDFEPEALRVAWATENKGRGLTLTPDFRVVLPDMTVEFREVKGRSGKKYYAREDAKLKLRVVADRHPYKFVVVWPKGKAGDGWNEEAQ